MPNQNVFNHFAAIRTQCALPLANRKNKVFTNAYCNAARNTARKRNNVSNAVFNGTATNADTLDTLNSTSFMRSDAATSNDTSISVLSDTGLYVGQLRSQ